MANKKLIKKLDTVFSKYTRLRDSAEYDHKLFKCCSCGQIKEYRLGDAGHFINRRWMALRWDERNVHMQCSSCNRFDEGNSAGYYQFMFKKYGEDVINILLAMKTSYRWTDGELDILIKDYKQKVKELETRI